MQTFLPFLGDFVAALISLIAEADTLEGKNRLTKSLSTVIECAGTQVCTRGYRDLHISPVAVDRTIH